MPIASARPPSRCCQNAWLASATGGVAEPSVRFVKSRPSIGLMPSTEKNCPRHHARAQQLGDLAVAEAHRAIGVGRVPFESRLLFGERQVVGDREAKLERWRVGVDADEALGHGIRQRTQHRRVDRR